MTDVLLTQAVEVRPSGVIASLVAVAEDESVQETLSNRPQVIAASSGTFVGPSTSGSADILGLAVVSILSVVGSEITDEDISLDPIIGPHATLVQVLVN